MMFSLSFVGGSKSAEGGPYPLTDLDRGSKSRGVQIRWDTGSTPEFSFPEMFLPHEHGNLLTKVVMLEIIFSI